MSSLILIFFSFNFSLPRKPIMNHFLLVLTFNFEYSLLNLLFIYYLHITVILQLVVMYFNTEWSKICPVPNIQINFGFLFYAQNNIKLVFLLNILLSNISIWNQVVFFFHLPYFLFTYFIVRPLQFWFQISNLIVSLKFVSCHILFFISFVFSSIKT